MSQKLDKMHPIFMKNNYETIPTLMCEGINMKNFEILQVEQIEIKI